MIAKDLISPKFPFLSPKDSIKKAKQLFSDNCVCHLAVVSQQQIEGILAAEVIPTESNFKGTIADLKDEFIRAQVYKEQHGLDIFEVIARLELSCVPVADENNNYLGTITTQDLLYTLSNYYSFKHIGGLIVLSMGLRDYNLSEISRIVESNNAKILLMYMDLDEANSTIQVTLKLNSLDIARILATFERFKYVVEYHQPDTESRDDMQERYDMLMKMLDL